jgi:murein DD-endopeptidase MepM/ murein hydrolase activator NlpD
MPWFLVVLLLAVVPVQAPSREPSGAGARFDRPVGARFAGPVDARFAGPVDARFAGPVDARFVWPVDAPRLVRRFDPPAQPWLAGHRGVDLAAPPAAIVRAAGPGTIVHAGRIAGRGVVSIRHHGGLRTTYEPVDIDVALQVGVPVTAGEPLGTLAAGHPGCPAAACLHWGLRRGEGYLDPLALLGLGRVRLLPW